MTYSTKSSTRPRSSPEEDDVPCTSLGTKSFVQLAFPGFTPLRLDLNSALGMSKHQWSHNLDAHPLPATLIAALQYPSVPAVSNHRGGQNESDVGKTTLMIRNVPTWYTQDKLAAEWGNEGDFDFLYLPFSVHDQQNLSYAFINFTTSREAAVFKDKWEKMRLQLHRAQKSLTVRYAKVQGLRDNLLLLAGIWQKKRLKHCPFVFADRQLVNLPMVMDFLDEQRREKKGYDKSRTPMADISMEQCQSGARNLSELLSASDLSPLGGMISL